MLFPIPWRKRLKNINHFLDHFFFLYMLSLDFTHVTYILHEKCAFKGYRKMLIQS